MRHTALSCFSTVKAAPRLAGSCWSTGFTCIVYLWIISFGFFFFSPARTESCVSDFFCKDVCMVTLLKKQFCSSLLSHIGTEKHLISNGSCALLCQLCTCLKSSAGSAGLLDASQFDMGLLHHDNHNLSSWKMLLHYHCGFLSISQLPVCICTARHEMNGTETVI